MVVQHNISGMNANRQLNITTGIQAKSSEKLSSGYKINRAADDAAGLAISEKMRRQIRGLSQASNNAQDGVSWCQIADGALDEVSNMISRAKELAVKAANETLTDSDRSYINEEMQKMASEIDRTHAATEFNNIKIFSDDGYAPNDAMITNQGAIKGGLPGGKGAEITSKFIGADGKEASAINPHGVGTETHYTDTDFVNFVENAAASAVSKISQNFNDLFAAASSDNIKIGLELKNIDGQSGTLAVAVGGYTTSSQGTGMTYTMQVDTADYPPGVPLTDEKKADLAATIAHEMTHLIMYDTLTTRMFGSSSTKFPKWFIEGSAQTSSGDGGWLTNHLNTSSTDAEKKAYMSKLTTSPNEYGAGYLATMYLGYAVSAKKGNTDVTSENIKNGLDDLMTDIATNKHSLSEAINALTDYASQTDFESKFKQADAPSLAFTTALLNAIGNNGAGSLLGNLGDSQATVFGNAGSGASTSSYIIASDNTKYGNSFGSEIDFPEGGGLGNTLQLQVGSESSSENQIELKRFNIRLDSLTEGNTFDTTTAEKALETIETVNIAGRNVASVRSYYGALQNRLEHTIKNLDNVVENTTAAESRIRDTDMAAEMVRYSNNNILAQAGQAMLAQANQSNQGVLSLLQ